MNEARFHYETDQHLRQHFIGFVNAQNFARRLRTLKGLTPYEFICFVGTRAAERLNVDPTHLSSGPTG
jgi:hypothetical protein